MNRRLFKIYIWDFDIQINMVTCRRL